MRHSKTIELSEGRLATVQELRVSEVRHLVSKFSDLANVDLKVMLFDRFAELSELTKQLLALPEGESIDDLTGSEIFAIVEAVLEVNRPFLALAGLEHLTGILSSGLTQNVADSSNADMSMSLTTDGDSSLLRPAEPADESVSDTDGGNSGQGENQTQ